ncbi:MAG: pyruvate, phosphate dikinase [Acidobacteria bacterium]|nr:pyruvate, phosphate dikinase [Acidobacteriota bacterium]MBK8147120.1 pyruvate, phosphate dikinase [Acidobacteriota bacterium]MBK8812323.1 pyruvate, phosphate dikinase [Acidobacteriota bacterium]
MDPNAQSTAKKWSYLFEEFENPNTQNGKNILGGKGAALANMTKLGLPIPPGFIITTECCNAYHANEKIYPDGLWNQVKSSISALEAKLGRGFGNASDPLLISVRSGSPVSMPGMMDTILNLGLNDQTVVGLARHTNDERFAWDAYRRFVSLFSQIVLGIEHEKFERVLDRYKAGVRTDSELTTDELKEILATYKKIVYAEYYKEFPDDVDEQLKMAIAAVFDSWMGKRAVDYRRVHRIPGDLGTAVNIQSMVFGNLGDTSGTGVCFTRNPSTGERALYGEYLLNAQGEDVVAGIRTPNPISVLQTAMPDIYQNLLDICAQLEMHYHEMQDIEFTIERGKLFILQTRSGKRTGASAVKIAVAMVREGLIDQTTAIQRVSAEQLDQLLHPMIDPDDETQVLATGLPASPGAAQGIVIFSPDEAEELAKAGEKVVLVRRETSPDDFHGMVLAQAILTQHGGMTSHAAVVARGMGKPCVAGASDLNINYSHNEFSVGDVTVTKGEWITVDGTHGNIYRGKINTIQPRLDEDFDLLMTWADGVRRLKVRANADTGHDSTVARGYGAQGIGLCRTEHMFFGESRLEVMREMILAAGAGNREKALDKLLPFQKQDFVEIFKSMAGLPVTIRLLDPPLHEFLPNKHDLLGELTELKFRARQSGPKEMDNLIDEIADKRKLLRRVEQLSEANPMLGLRGCRLGIVVPEVTRMQVRAIVEAACEVAGEGIEVHPEIMIPLVSSPEEFRNQAEIIREVARKVMDEHGMELKFLVGTMIELPRAALVADQIAADADFFSFGTNDLTQTTLGLSRDDSARFLPFYVDKKIYPDDPFQTLDTVGVGELIKIAIERGRRVNPSLKVGICGEHGGDPRSIEFFNSIGLDYVSCSPFRVPIARLSSAHSVLKTAA